MGEECALLPPTRRVASGDCGMPRYQASVAILAARPTRHALCSRLQAPAARCLWFAPSGELLPPCMRLSDPRRCQVLESSLNKLCFSTHFSQGPQSCPSREMDRVCGCSADGE